MAPDDLIARVQQRAADPNRRVDVRPNVFSANVMSMDLGSLLGKLGGAAADLKRVVAANQAGRVDPELVTKADRIAADMSTPVETTLPGRARPAAVEGIETELGFSLPPVLRRVYLEVADGGFGPGGGLMPIADTAAAYARLRTGAELPRARTWPERLLPVVGVDPGYDCVDASSPQGRVVAWDPDGLAEFSGEKAWNRSFSEVAPSVEAWLEEWVGGKTQAEKDQDFMRQMMIDEARRSRAHFAAMTPEERAAFGFPEVGWEYQIADGLGMEEDEER
jgi:SMI1 / KNR4 family (SUKH-1)